MEFSIRRLTPDMAEDFFDFFENRGFHDHLAWRRCYCLAPYEPAPEGEKGRNRRERAMEYLAAGRIQGYLAFADGVPVGWCNADDKTNYRSLAARKSLWEESERGKKVKAVICFCVALEMRGKGIATALLRRVCTDAKEEGYAYVEAYPRKGDVDQYANHHVPLSMYQRQGFAIVEELERDYIVRTSA